MALPKLNKDERMEVLRAYQMYVQEMEDPHDAGFIAHSDVAQKYFITKQNLIDWKEFRPWRDLANAKQEDYLLTAKNTVMSIFRLKQPAHGYKDKTEQDITTNGERVTFHNTLPRVAKAPVKLPRKHVA